MTTLGDGSRAPKASGRCEVMGELDELGCVLGLFGRTLRGGRARLLRSVQNDLFDLGADLSLPGGCLRLFSSAHPARLGLIVRGLRRELNPAKGFVLPGGRESAAWAHLARAVCRRTERRIWALKRGGAAARLGGAYLNCLGELLYVLARETGGEQSWIPRNSLRGRGKILRKQRAR